MTFTLVMLTLLPIGLITAAILLTRLPDETGDIARLQRIKARQATREAGETR